MILTDELLVQFADGTLPPETAAEVQRALQADSAAAERHRLIVLSGQTLADASTIADDPSGTEALARSIRSGELDADQHDRTDDVAARQRLTGRFQEWRMSGMQMAAGLVLLLSGLLAGYVTANFVADTDATVVAGQPTWIVRVVDYHTLYGRETVAAPNLNKDDIAALQTRFEAVLKSRMHIPNLRSRDLAFKRGQILRFGDVPIIQLAYLPGVTGTPVALCLKPTSEADSAPAYFEFRDMGVVRWKQNGLSYVLVGERSKADLMSDARKARSEITASDTI